MPAYELFLIVKNLPRVKAPELIQAIKRGAELIINRNGNIRAFENIGYKNLPYQMRSKEGYQKSGNYMIIKFDSPRQEVQSIVKEIKNEGNFLRTSITPLSDEQTDVECVCKENETFSKHGFDFEKPMTSWDKKRIYKNYGRRL